MKRLVLIGGILLLVAAVAVGVDKYQKSRIAIPAKINSQINFPVLIPSKQSPMLNTDETSFKFDKSQGVLSFIVSKSGKKITITEQTYPEALIFDKLVGTLNQYSEIQTKIGKVELTRPKNAGNSQVAVANSHSQTLIFARASGDLRNDQWQELFNNLEITK
jgi:hypothetical protein